MQRHLGAGGPLSSLLPGYVEREAQLTMAEAVAATLSDGGVLVCEAATGTGKSLAYLVPALLGGGTVIVSTATKALQSQLLHQDVPLACAAAGRSARVELLKGRANYVCRLHAADVTARLLDERMGAAFARLQHWLGTTRTGDRAELDHEPPEALWSELAVGAERCRGGRCPAFDGCYAEAARRRAGEADIVLVNHALLFADLALRHASDGRVGILPAYDAVILDEAHEIEGAAAEWLGARLAMFDLLRLARDAERACQMDRASLPRSALHALERDATALFATLPSGRGRTRMRERDLRDLPPLAVAGLRSALAATSAGLAGAGEECDLVARSADRLGAALEACIHADHDEAVVWCERDRPGSVALRSAPVDVGRVLRELLWDVVPAAILCSATLSVGGDLGFARRRLGIEHSTDLVLPTPFEYERQALLYVPADAPDPRAPGWDEALARQVIGLVRASRGRALCLFTSRRALDAVHAAALRELDGMTLLRQGDEPRERLLARFRAEVDSVLFATASFWQGVDVPGESCSLVVIDRLPFPHPGDPLVEARCERIDREGGSAFDDYSLPAAALALRQGFGRLLRRDTDRGVVAVLDGRLLGARYGGRLLEALPPAPRASRLHEVAAFLAAPSGYPAAR